MMEMLDISIPNANPEAGRGQSIHLPPSLLKQVFPEDDMIGRTRPGRRAGGSHSGTEARADGFYTRGKLKYKLQKGSELPKKYDQIFYYGEMGIEREEKDNPMDGFAARLAVDEGEAGERETNAEDGGESPEKPKRPARRRKPQTEEA